MSKFAFFYTTIPDREVAHRIAHELLGNKLAACVNLLPGVTSFYWWEDKIQQEEEYILLIKSKSSFYAAIQTTILSLHPYQCPAILQIPIEEGSPAFLQWMENSLRKGK